MMIRLSRGHWAWIGGLVLVGLMAYGGNRMLRVHYATGYLYDTVPSGDLKEARKYLAWGADPDDRSGHAETVLCMAVDSGHVEMAELLLDYGADPNLARPDGRTPLSLAVYRQDAACVAVLVEHGADLHATGPYGLPLADAAGRGDLASVEVLLAHGAGCGEGANVRDAAIYAAAIHGHVHVFDRLAELDCDDVFDAAAINDLAYMALTMNRPAFAEKFVARGADLHRTIEYAPNRFGTAFHGIHAYDVPDAVAYLVELGVDINAVDNLGMTPLDLLLDSILDNRMNTLWCRLIAKRAAEFVAHGGRSREWTDAEVAGILWLWDVR